MVWSSLFGRRKRRSYPAELLGCWTLVRADAPEYEPGAEIDFQPDGRMLYSIPTPDTWQIIKLTWWVEEKTIVTDQPSARRVVRTEYWFDSHETLVLKGQEGGCAWFTRAEKGAPDV